MVTQKKHWSVVKGQNETVMNIFSQISHIYDPMSHLISFGLASGWRTQVARHLALSPGVTVLDLGTGTADLAIAIAHVADPATRLIGIDITPEMLEQGRHKIYHLGLQERIELRIGDVAHLDLADNSVDCCCSAFLLRNLVDLSQGLREMLRVVGPGGRVVCLEISHPPGRVLSPLFHCYFYKIAPLFSLLLGQKFETYNYLPDSLKHFPHTPELKSIMEKCGWHNVHFHHLNGGLVTIYVGTKL